MPECFSVAVDRDAGGKILRREEHWPEGVRRFRYAYDASGHLLRVQCDGREREAYAYNEAGQRVEDMARGIRYMYDADGRLTHAGALRMAYDKGGRLVRRTRQDAAAARASVPPLLRETPVRCVDARSGLGYDWGYEGGAEPLPTHVGIQGEAVRRLGHG